MDLAELHCRVLGFKVRDRGKMCQVRGRKEGMGGGRVSRGATTEKGCRAWKARWKEEILEEEGVKEVENTGGRVGRRNRWCNVEGKP